MPKEIKMTMVRIFLSFFLLSIAICANAKTHTLKISFVDTKAQKYYVEVEYEDNREWDSDVIIYNNSDPSNKIYGKGIGIRKNWQMVFDERVLINFDKGQKDESLYHLLKDKTGYYFAPMDTRDPRWRIPCTIVKSN